MDIKEYKQKLQELHDEYFGKNIGGGGESSSSKITKLKIKSTSGDTMVKVLDGDGYKLYNWCKKRGFGYGVNSIPDVSEGEFEYKYLANQQLLENNTEDKITTYFLFEGWAWFVCFSNDTVSTGVTSKNNTWMYYCFNWSPVVYRPYPCYRPSFSFNEI